MLQRSKILSSRDDWKRKATLRGHEIREFRKIKNRHLDAIATLKIKNAHLKLQLEVKKTTEANNSF
jgi:hypothetical protein